jgi:hypothetical protein
MQFLFRPGLIGARAPKLSTNLVGFPFNLNYKLNELEAISLRHRREVHEKEYSFR